MLDLTLLLVVDVDVTFTRCAFCLFRCYVTVTRCGCLLTLLIVALLGHYLLLVVDCCFQLLLIVVNAIVCWLGCCWLLLLLHCWLWYLLCVFVNLRCYCALLLIDGVVLLLVLLLQTFCCDLLLVLVDDCCCCCCWWNYCIWLLLIVIYYLVIVVVVIDVVIYCWRARYWHWRFDLHLLVLFDVDVYLLLRCLIVVGVRFGCSFCWLTLTIYRCDCTLFCYFVVYVDCNCICLFRCRWRCCCWLIYVLLLRWLHPLLWHLLFCAVTAIWLYCYYDPGCCWRWCCVELHGYLRCCCYRYGIAVVVDLIVDVTLCWRLLLLLARSWLLPRFRSLRCEALLLRYGWLLYVDVVDPVCYYVVGYCCCWRCCWLTFAHCV